MRFNMQLFRDRSSLPARFDGDTLAGLEGSTMRRFVIVIAAIVSKFLACGLGAIRLGWKTAAKIGVGMVPRGEVGMVVAQLGLSSGILTQRSYGAVVLMAVLTTVVTPIFLRFVFEAMIF